MHPGKRLLLQKHLHRMEHWAIVAGEGLMTLDATAYKVCKGDVVLINQEQVHRIENTGSDYLVFIETQLGLFIEDDIIWIEDDWGRTTPIAK